MRVKFSLSLPQDKILGAPLMLKPLFKVWFCFTLISPTTNQFKKGFYRFVGIQKPKLYLKIHINDWWISNFISPRKKFSFLEKKSYHICHCACTMTVLATDGEVTTSDWHGRGILKMPDFKLKHFCNNLYTFVCPPSSKCSTFYWTAKITVHYWV